MNYGAYSECISLLSCVVIELHLQVILRNYGALKSQALTVCDPYFLDCGSIHQPTATAVLKKL